jgi:hypothetical protein
MKIKQITETTTAGSIATVNSPLGGTQSRGNTSIYGGKKVGTLFKGKKTSAPYANSINESAELSEAQLEEDDVIVVPGQGRKSKTGFVPHGQSRVDHEVEMARSDLFSAAKNAQQVFSMIKDVSEDEGLDGWVQEKIIKANDYLNTIREYLEGKQIQGVNEGPEFGSKYAEKLAQYVYNVRPNLNSEDDVLNIGYKVAVQDLASQTRAVSLFSRDQDFPSDFVSAYRYLQKRRGVTEGSQRVDSLVTDALKIMRGAEVSDAVRALTTVLGNREYNSRRGFYNFYIKQILDTYGQQGMNEGADEGIRPQGKILKRLRDIAIMSPTLTFQNFRQSGKEAIITDAMMACKIMKRHFLQNKNQPTAQFIYNLENEIYDFMRGRKLDTPDGNSYTMDLSDLSRGTLGKMQFQPKDSVAEGAKVDRMVKHIEKSEKKLGKSKDEAENIAWATANKRGMLNNKNKKA